MQVCTVSGKHSRKNKLQFLTNELVINRKILENLLMLVSCEILLYHLKKGLLKFNDSKMSSGVTKKKYFFFLTLL